MTDELRARIEELTRELDEARALAAARTEEAVKEATKRAQIYDHDICGDGRVSDLFWGLVEALDTLARPEETDALAKIRAEERERCAKIAEARHWDDPVDAVERAHNKAVRAIAAAIREN